METLSSGSLRQPHPFDDLIYSNREPDFRLFFLCIGQAEIRKNIAGTRDDSRAANSSFWHIASRNLPSRPLANG
jgi:hypothetical protein